MPAIRGIYYNHPQTSEAGLWVWLAWGNNSIVGLTDVQINALVPTTGAVKDRPAKFRQAMIAAFQPLLEQRTSLLNWTIEERYLPVEDDCYIEGDYYVARMCLVDFEVISLSPLRYNITVSEGASYAYSK